MYYTQARNLPRHFNSPPLKHLCAGWKGHSLLQGNTACSSAPPQCLQLRTRKPLGHRQGGEGQPGSHSCTPAAKEAHGVPAALGRALPAGQVRASAATQLAQGPRPAAAGHSAGGQGTLPPWSTTALAAGTISGWGRLKQGGCSPTPRTLRVAAGTRQGSARGPERSAPTEGSLLPLPG